jgi:hypothetical protein
MPRRADMIRIGTRIGAGVLLAAMLAGCSDLYYDRRDTVSFAANDAMATARAAQIIDPWPAASANRNIAANGVVVQSAVERYRTCQVIQPKGASSSGAYGNAQTATQPGCTPQPAAAASAATSTQGVNK